MPKVKPITLNLIISYQPVWCIKTISNPISETGEYVVDEQPFLDDDGNPIVAEEEKTEETPTEEQQDESTEEESKPKAKSKKPRAKKPAATE